MSVGVLLFCALVVGLGSVKDPECLKLVQDPSFAAPSRLKDGGWLATPRIDGRNALQFVGIHGDERIVSASLTAEDGSFLAKASVAPCDPHWGLPPWAIVPEGCGYGSNESFLVEACIPADAGRWRFRVNFSSGSIRMSEIVDERGALETEYWQREIDQASCEGGGTVLIPRGRHRVGGLFLKNNVTLKLEKGAVLEGVADIGQYKGVPLDYVEVKEPWTAIVFAVGITNVAVVGEGTVFGNGSLYHFNSIGSRPRGMIFYRCQNVQVKGITFRDLATWTCYLKECRDVVVSEVTVDSHANMNSDGLDIESQNVLVENCDIDSGDDGICLKSDNPDFCVTNVHVRNCVVRTPCTALKLGTASHGGFKDISFENCTVARPRRAVRMPCADLPFWGYERMCSYPGFVYDGRPTPPVPGIGIENVDGGFFDGIRFSGIHIDECLVPLFVRMGERRHRKFETSEIHIPFGRNPNLSSVVISDVKANALSATASAIAGVPGFRPRGISLRNVHCRVKGGCSEAAARRIVPEKPNAYPDPCMFDCQVLPAFGLYVRHADDVTLKNCLFKCETASDPRPEIVEDDAIVIRE